MLWMLSSVSLKTGTIISNALPKPLPLSHSPLVPCRISLRQRGALVIFGLARSCFRNSSKAAARELSDVSGVKLIFPAPDTKADLDDQSDLNVANILLAEVKADCARTPQELAHAAKLAVQKRWKEFAESAYQPVKDEVDGALWKMQVDDVIEFYAAWTEFTELTVPAEAPSRHASSRRTEKPARLQTCRRKARRAQLPPDGAREKRSEQGFNLEQKQERARNLSLSVEGEELDVVGLTKRLAGGGRKLIHQWPALPLIRGCVEPNRNRSFSRLCSTMPIH